MNTNHLQLLKYVCDYSFDALAELTHKDLPVSHCGSLWIQFFCNEEEAAQLSFKATVDNLR
jgi:hypothetical protein